MAVLRRHTPSAAGPAAPVLAKGPKKRVLYVEDDDLNYEVLELLLQGDFEMVRASTAAQAMALISYQAFDVLLLDIQLSGSKMNGLEIAQAVQATYGPNSKRARPKIIMLTASTLADGQNPLPGAVAILRKPVDLPGLLRAMGDGGLSLPNSAAR